MKGLFVFLMLIPLLAFAGSGSNQPGGESGGGEVKGNPSGYNYIGKGLQVGKPASSSKSVDSTKSGTQSGTKGKKGKGDCGK